MNRVLLAAAVTCCMGVCASVSAQPPADCVPSVLNIPGAPYPCVFPDHRIMFRVAAPDATKVRIRLGPGFDMSKEPDGLWYGTTTPQVVGFHYYTVSIDGAVVADPATQTFFGSGWYNSAIEVPDPEGDYYRMDKFAYIGGFSGSTGGRGGFDPKTAHDGVLADAAAFNRKVKVVFLGIGSEEGPGTKAFSDQLTQAGINNVFFLSPGTAHEWLTWRRCFKEFAPRLFR